MSHNWVGSGIIKGLFTITVINIIITTSAKINIFLASIIIELIRIVGLLVGNIGTTILLLLRLLSRVEIEKVFIVGQRSLEIFTIVID